MKKVVLFLSFVFIGALAMNTYANTVKLNSDNNITIVDIEKDKKDCCKDGKTCDKCAEAKADAKAKTSTCTKSQKASCCSSKKATTTTTTTTTEPVKEKN